MTESRAPARLVMESIKNLLEGIDVDGDTMAVGDGTDPNHDVPYLVMKRATSFNYDGPMDDTDSDEEIRLMVIGVGDTREQADWARDKARAALTKSAVTAQFTTDAIGRACMTCKLDLSYDQKFDRGRAVPRFSSVDQYLIKHTPT